MAQGYEEEAEDKPSCFKVFIGNLAPDVSTEAVEDVIRKCGDVDRVIMKRGATHELYPSCRVCSCDNVHPSCLSQSPQTAHLAGFCFCYFKSHDDAQACISEYDDRECQEITDHRLRVEMARGRDQSRFRSDKEIPPNRNLFVVNYEPEATRREDLEKFFEQWGTVERVQMKDKYSFVEFQDVEMATTALQESQTSQFNGRILTVEYVQSRAPARRPAREESPPRSERRESRESRPPPRSWGRERPYERSDYYRYEPYDRYEPYEYYDYYARDRYAPRERYPPYPPAYHRAPPPHSYRPAPRYGSPIRYSSRSPPPAAYSRVRSPAYSHPVHRGRGSRSP